MAAGKILSLESVHWKSNMLLYQICDMCLFSCGVFIYITPKIRFDLCSVAPFTDLKPLFTKNFYCISFDIVVDFSAHTVQFLREDIDLCSFWPSWKHDIDYLWSNMRVIFVQSEMKLWICDLAYLASLEVQNIWRVSWQNETYPFLKIFIL